jgi:hypothetical protein
MKHKNFAFRCDEINIPKYQLAQDISESCDEAKQMKILIFKAYIKYLSTEIFEFYENYLTKNGYETVNLKRMNYNARKWIKGYSESKGKRKYSAQFTAFWLNRKKNQIWWFDINSDAPDPTKMKKKNVNDMKQYVVIIVKVLDPIPPLDQIDISYFYPELSESEIEKENKEKEIDKRQFQFAGYYTLGNSKLYFRIAKLPSSKYIPEKYVETYDIDGRLYFVSKNIEFSEEDIDHLIVKKSNYSNSINIEFTFKDKFINQYQKKGAKLKGKWLGLFKEEKLVFVGHFHESIEKVMVLNFDDLSTLEIILKGMIKREK